MTAADTDPLVLILTSDADATADAVVAELERRGTPTARVDLGDFPTELRLCATTTPGGWVGGLRGTRVSVDLARVRAVYYQRPSRFRLPAGLSPTDEVFAAAEARHAIGGLLASLTAHWVNDPIRQAAADYKPLQLATAAACGLRTPTTLVSNQHADALAFAAEVGGPVVCKPLSGLAFGDGDEVRMAYTTPIDPMAIPPAQFAATAHLVQAWVPKAYEARVTVIGREPHTVVIRSDSAAGRVDWRSDYDSLTYEYVTTPGEIAGGMRRFMNTLGLRFGAFDFVVTPAGEWVMLECNPAGQWLWLEHETGAPLTAAMADLLNGGGSW